MIVFLVQCSFSAFFFSESTPRIPCLKDLQSPLSRSSALGGLLLEVSSSPMSDTPGFSLMAILLQRGDCTARNLPSGGCHTNNTKLKQDHLKLVRQHLSALERRPYGANSCIDRTDAVLMLPRASRAGRRRVPSSGLASRFLPRNCPGRGELPTPDSRSLMTRKQHTKASPFMQLETPWKMVTHGGPPAQLATLAGAVLASLCPFHVRPFMPQVFIATAWPVTYSVAPSVK